MTRLAKWRHMVITKDRFFYPTLTFMTYSFYCSPLNTTFIIFKSFPVTSAQTEMFHITMTLVYHNNDAPSQQAHDAKPMACRRRCDVMTYRRWWDVVLRLCACWVVFGSVAVKVFSSEPMAPWELIGWDWSCRLRVHAFMNTFKHEYFQDH